MDEGDPGRAPASLKEPGLRQSPGVRPLRLTSFASSPYEGEPRKAKASPSVRGGAPQGRRGRRLRQTTRFPKTTPGPASSSHLALPLGELSPEVTERVPGQALRWPPSQAAAPPALPEGEPRLTAGAAVGGVALCWPFVPLIRRLRAPPSLPGGKVWRKQGNFSLRGRSCQRKLTDEGDCGIALAALKEPGYGKGKPPSDEGGGTAQAVTEGEKG